MRTLIAAVVIAAFGGTALAAKKAEKAGAAPSSRAIGELMGKFKWGMSTEEAVKVVEADIHEKFAEKLKKEEDLYRQDQLRKEEEDEVNKFRTSKVAFDGQRSGWDVSIIDKEFAQKNNESMLVMWEADQRRFLFFWNDKLYKMYVAFNSEHPVFKGKKFDDFAQIIQNRYGPAKRVTAKLRTKDEQVLDHLEWPPAGDFLLSAIDQSNFYGNFCLSVAQNSVLADLEKARGTRADKKPQGNAVIDAVTAPETVQGDANADIVDEVLGRKTQRTNQGGTNKKKK